MLGFGVYLQVPAPMCLSPGHHHSLGTLEPQAGGCRQQGHRHCGGKRLHFHHVL